MYAARFTLALTMIMYIGVPVKRHGKWDQWKHPPKEPAIFEREGRQKPGSLLFALLTLLYPPQKGVFDSSILLSKYCIDYFSNKRSNYSNLRCSTFATLTLMISTICYFDCCYCYYLLLRPRPIIVPQLCTAHNRRRVLPPNSEDRGTMWWDEMSSKPGSLPRVKPRRLTVAVLVDRSNAQLDLGTLRSSRILHAFSRASSRDCRRWRKVEISHLSSSSGQIVARAEMAEGEIDLLDITFILLFCRRIWWRVLGTVTGYIASNAALLHLYRFFFIFKISCISVLIFLRSNCEINSLISYFR